MNTDQSTAQINFAADAHLGSGENFSILEKLLFNQKVSRVWRRYLTPYEFMLMTYIADRTVGWGHLSFIASTENIINGTDEYSGVGLSRRTYFTAMASLEAKGFIARKMLPKQRCRISINIAWKAEEYGIDPRNRKRSTSGTGASFCKIGPIAAPVRCVARTLNTYSKNTGSKISAFAADAAAARQLPTMKHREKPSSEKKEPGVFGATKESGASDTQPIRYVASGGSYAEGSRS